MPAIRASSPGGRRHARRPDELLEPQARDLALLLGSLAELGLGVVAQAAIELGEHVVRAPAGRVDQEDVAEPLLVRAVALLEPTKDILGGVGRSGLLPRRPRRTGPLADPRVRRERLQPVLGLKPGPDVVRALEQPLEVPERAAFAKAGGPGARAAA